MAEFKVFEVRFDFIPGRFSKSLKWGSKTFKDFEVRFDFIPGMRMGLKVSLKGTSILTVDATGPTAGSARGPATG